MMDARTFVRVVCTPSSEFEFAQYLNTITTNKQLNITSYYNNNKREKIVKVEYEFLMTTLNYMRLLKLFGNTDGIEISKRSLSE